MTTKQVQWVALYSCAVAALILAMGNRTGVRTAHAQVAIPPAYETTSDTDAETHKAKMHDNDVCKASDVVGMDVRAVGNDETIGSINDLVIQKNGRIAYAAVSFGGFLGMGDKLFAVPMDAIEFVKVGDGADADVYARIDVTEQSLKSRQGFDQDHWPKEADRSFSTGQERIGSANTLDATQ
jgi:hypothetical protein